MSRQERLACLRKMEAALDLKVREAGYEMRAASLRLEYWEEAHWKIRESIKREGGSDSVEDDPSLVSRSSQNQPDSKPLSQETEDPGIRFMPPATWQECPSCDGQLETVEGQRCLSPHCCWEAMRNKP